MRSCVRKNRRQDEILPPDCIPAGSEDPAATNNCRLPTRLRASRYGAAGPRTRRAEYEPEPDMADALLGHTVVAGIRIRLHEHGVRRVSRQRAGEYGCRRDRADVERRVDRVEHVEHFAEQLQARRAADGDALGHAQVELRERSAAAAVDRLARAHLVERRIAGIIHVLEPVRGRVDVVADAVEVVVVAVPDVHRQRRPVAEDRRHGDAHGAWMTALSVTLCRASVRAAGPSCTSPSGLSESCTRLVVSSSTAWPPRPLASASVYHAFI